jgi:hypothetical protein
MGTQSTRSNARMPRFPRRYRSLRPLGATLLALSVACAIAAPLSLADTTIEFTDTPQRSDHIDLGLPDGDLGVGRASFSLTRKDRQALQAAKQQEELQDRAQDYLAASTEASNRIAAIRQLLADAQEDEARLRSEIEARMVQRYKDGDAGDLEFLLSGDGLSDLVNRGRMLEDQSKRDKRSLQEYALTVDRIKQYERVLEELRDLTGEQAARLDQRSKRLDEVLVSARLGHQEDEAPPKAPAKSVKGTWYVMDGAFQAQLFLPNAGGSNYDGGTRTPARRATPLQIQQVLADSRIDLDASGYNDVLTGQIDGRILDAMVLAAAKFHYIKVTSLKSDHGVYTTSGNVSEHSYGCAMDIGTIGSTYITPSAQVTGGEVYQAVLFFNGLGSIKPDLAPHQVISLFELGGATLAMGDHGDHIHVGYSC